MNDKKSLQALISYKNVKGEKCRGLEKLNANRGLIRKPDMLFDSISFNGVGTVQIKL